MEYIPGPTLRTIVATRGVPPLGKALDLIASVFDALGTAHRAGIVHRDVKPENVLISSDSGVKVADFGLARAVTEVTAASSGVVLGTVAYLAPELVDRGVADARADVYAAGVMLYELLTGVQPFTGDTPIQIAFQHVNSSVSVPSRRVPWLPPAVDTLVARLTAKDPDARPADGGEALRLIREVREHLAPDLADRTPAPPDSPTVAVRPSSSEPDGPAPELALPVPSVPPTVRGLPPAASPPSYAARRVSTSERAHSVNSTGTQLLGRVPPAAPADDGGPRQPPVSRTSAHRRRPLAARRKARRIALLTASIVLIVAIGATAAGFYWYQAYGPGASIEAPDVVGMAETDAVTAIEGRGLRAEVSRDWSDTAPEGEVVSASPPARMDVDPGAVIALIVSQGLRHESVPDGLTGLTPEDAAQTLINANLDGPIQTEEAYDEEIAEGQVVSVQPAPGEVVAHDAAITLVVSRGREPIKVPKLVGLTLDEAEEAMDTAGLTLDPSGEEYSETVPRGEILSQFPPRGRELFRGDKVSVTVSKGRQPIEIPDLVDMSSDSAAAELEALGFAVEIQALVPGSVTLNRVSSTSPGAGEYAYLGDTIIIVVV
ncbi:MAG: PASTA domain-containing protein, partial [Bifidobacteriaceae bacterium]|jgi:serine/threonine-protein kinase|nr:PASTA domain-containing protein [Bifidobacteriaceae bacterium]